MCTVHLTSEIPSGSGPGLCFGGRRFDSHNYWNMFVWWARFPVSWCFCLHCIYVLVYIQLSSTHYTSNAYFGARLWMCAMFWKKLPISYRLVLTRRLLDTVQKGSDRYFMEIHITWTQAKLGKSTTTDDIPLLRRNVHFLRLLAYRFIDADYIIKIVFMAYL